MGLFKDEKPGSMNQVGNNGFDLRDRDKWPKITEIESARNCADSASGNFTGDFD